MEIQLTEEELKEFRSRADRYDSVRSDMAETAFNIEMLKRKRQSLVANYDLAESSLEDFKQDLAKKYKDKIGEKFTVNLHTGVLASKND